MVDHPVPERGSPGRRPALAGIRVRSALAATAVVAVALVAASAVLLVLLQRSLIGSASSAAATRARDVAAVVRDEGEEELAATLRSRALSGEPVQVLAADGTVLASSAPRPDERPLGDLRPRPAESMSSSVGRLNILDLDEHYVLAARGVRHGARDYVVLAAVGIDSRRETVGTVGLYLLAGVPVLLVVVGGATFVFVSRSLRPVERIRRRVAEIGGRHLDARVPVPASRDEIARLAETMNAMLDRLQAAQDAQRRFVADASHELRSPLAILRVGLDVAAPTAKPEHWSELHAGLSEECDRMTRLVEDLLLLAKADENSIALHLRDVDLDDLVGAEARRLRTGTALHIEVHTEPVRVCGDAVKLAQVVRNLVENAALHTHGRIVLRLYAEPDAAVLEVADDGPGIPVADRERVFERFVRLEASRDRAHGGSGLGLAIVREIVAGHHGTVAVAQAPGGGALFRLRLPLDLDAQ